MNLKKAKRRSGEDRIVDTLVNVLLVLVAVVSVFPLLFVVAASLTPYSEILRNGGYVIVPRDITIDAYARLFAEPEIPRALGVTVFITVVGVAFNMALTTLLAYPLSNKKLPGRTVILMGVLFTMLFNAGLIPTYLVVQATGLVDTIWGMIIPGAVAVFNLLVMKTFFERLPLELFEAARIDGAGEFRILVILAVPLSVPVLMTLTLFYAVGQWNTYMQAILYVRDSALYPLQVVIHNILERSQSLENIEAAVPTVTLQMAAVVVAAAPMVAIYPFIQRHFQKGVTLGSVKG
ncbi:carbohydrate ABC transporter permease [Ruania halotolerans]|uniref:carbohydrate ABC transporter permease n=1 Tax=Ruania halotolerans TaxID=2897773 RepID=UPI001E45A0D0|nr:carbohydrate ABC transporter permease [Ruania halotolerans]UFU06137.1 carbohydrate ABC transporter permease [Ruania halotolerans]